MHIQAHLIDGRVTACQVVLRHPVDLGDPREVIPQVVLWLRADDFLKVLQRLLVTHTVLITSSGSLRRAAPRAGE